VTSAENQTSPEGTEAATGTEAQPAATDAPASEPAASADTFPREYVEQLRAEAAEHRVKAQRAEDLSARLLAATKQNVVGDILRSTSDLPDGDYLDQDGLPDEAKIRAAAVELIQTKPWLARPRGEVGQGPRPQPESVSLGALLREAAR
jgi:hypothetical protein